MWEKGEKREREWKMEKRGKEGEKGGNGERVQKKGQKKGGGKDDRRGKEEGDVSEKPVIYQE